ncbi:Spermidine hydroxycinnamoyl transferase [Sesamum alatum]|uniref:Spermidine hydroxycinnamoyl transferase n=1 Tax=Sesamum alatum TaxID=300844 RepID=A0AAE2CRD0_9LAMI|nr:Spermidine hydroxycinnamoyl transferase [Sesamum alatum]
MKINLNSSCLVKPAEPTWNGSLALSELDQIGSLAYVSLIHLYRPPQDWSEAISRTLKSSFSKVLVPFHPLAGRWSRTSGGRLQIECSGLGVPLTEAESEATLDELKEFEHHQLVPSVDLEPLPLVAVQLTRFKCGGVCLGVAMSHAAVDGQSASHFYTEWARLARGEQLQIQPFLDRKLLGDLGRKPHYASPPPPEFDAPPLLIGESSCKSEREKITIRASLRLTKFQIEMLRRKANENRGPASGSSFTSYETITGHIWRCSCKARRHMREQQTRLSISVDIRRRVQPPLPKTYLGNAVLDVMALDYAGDLVSKPLFYAASKVREAINKVTTEYVASTIDFLSGVDDLSSFQDWNSISIDDDGKGFFFGNPNLCVTSWLTLKFHGLDFGWGKEIYMGPVDYGSDGDCLIVPSGNDGDGSVIVIVCLQEAHMEALKKFFYEDMELLVHESCCLNSDRAEIIDIKSSFQMKV